MDKSSIRSPHQIGVSCTPAALFCTNQLGSTIELILPTLE
jgi:hypothetical protein